MTAPHPLETPARRRRHARLIATLAELIGDCANAAGTVYRPIANAAPEQGDVPFNLLPIVVLGAAAGPRLDAARQEDAARWPDAVAREETEGQRTFEARCAAAEADQVLVDAVLGPVEDDLPGPGAIALPTASQSAAMALPAISADFLASFLDDPEAAIGLVKAATSTGEFTVGQILDDAVDTAVLAGLMILRGLQNPTDPSAAAETCLMATRQFTQAVIVASADLADVAV
ncbi:hypothetical protein OG730_41475 (plasmid) [Streptomyces sp. NBC_01298]|uniref:hypothetical protein n=1 Tax=Streptomyces sp. NBC_01298 TaxID=2903817 RepID=UPI002E164ECA|nr:hypothetical protein OG730_42550 [Streptomyces sp. NBC_01298]WSK25940.1 hypothetical protein OG730_41475 [Streptomyces sp. NBC_01298]